MMYPSNLTLLDFRAIVSSYLTGRRTSRSRAPPNEKADSKRKYQDQFQEGILPSHLPESQNILIRCKYCYKEGTNLKTYVKCAECGISSCLIKEKNCLKKHHS